MSLALTPEILAATYELLRATQPFRRWKMPHADEIVFRVVRSIERSPDIWAQHFSERQTDKPAIAKGRHLIDINEQKVGHLTTLIPLMAHEMGHLQESRVIKNYTGEIQHGATWHRLADQICKHHGFDRKAF